MTATQRPRILNIVSGERAAHEYPDAFIGGLHELGELELIDHGERFDTAELLRRYQQAEIALLAHRAMPLPAALATEPGRLRYVHNLHGALRGMAPIELIESPIPVSNWGPAPARRVAEGALALVLACLKDLHRRVVTVRGDGWQLPGPYGGTLIGARVGVYGAGFIGRAFIEMLRPFDCRIRVYDPFAPELPEGCLSAESLRDLFTTSEIVAIHAGLTEATRGSVNAELLALLPDGGILVNTARGAIVDQAALFAELERGRLRAGLDVLDGPDCLATGHPARRFENLILTGHAIEHGWPAAPGKPGRMLDEHHICLANIRRFVAGEPILYEMTPERYRLST